MLSDGNLQCTLHGSQICRSETSSLSCLAAMIFTPSSHPHDTNREASAQPWAGEARMACCHVQGHVVAEQQLPVPLHWFGGGPMQHDHISPPTPAPSPPDTLQLEETGSSYIITGPESSRIVVSSALCAPCCCHGNQFYRDCLAGMPELWLCICKWRCTCTASVCRACCTICMQLCHVPHHEQTIL